MPKSGALSPVFAAILLEGGKTLLKVAVIVLEPVKAAKFEIVKTFPLPVHATTDSSLILSSPST